MDKIIFFGTPEVAAKVLRKLSLSFEVLAVVTSPDKPVGRKQIVTPPPTKTVAEELGIPVLQPEKLDEDFQNKIKELSPSIGIVVAYGKIIPQKLIDIFPKGLLNIHYSLLPEFRGASPVESAILSGKKETGVTIQKLIFKLDAGPIVAVEKFPIDEKITTPELKEKLTEIGSELLVKTLPDYLSRKIEPQEQDESKATHSGKISKSDGEIKDSDEDMNKWLKYRAYFGWPGVFYFDPEGKRVKITEATFENGKFTIKKIVPEGKKEVSL
jgi:methionyl-tRNA formyltransferase